MKALHIFLFSILLLISCDKTDCCDGIPGDDAIFELSIVNTLGEDLLNPETLGSIDLSKIRLYDVNDGEEVLIFNSMRDAQYGYITYERENMIRIRPFFDTSKKLNIVGYIKWNTEDYDTLNLTLVQQSKYTKRLTRIIYNDVEVWNDGTTPLKERYFQIVK